MGGHFLDDYTTTLLPSGKVLITGGDYLRAYAGCEVYDPKTGTWSPTGSLVTARYSHTATLLPSGKVLVLGGYNPDGVDGWDSPTLATAEVYDPGTGTWSRTGSLATGRSGHTATLLPSGKVLVLGGATDEEYFNKAEVYDPETGTSSLTPNTSLEGYTAVLLRSGKVLVTDGKDAEVYDPGTGTWSRTGSLAMSRYAYTATLLPSGKVLVAAGGTLTAEVYDPETGTWSRTGSLAIGRDGHTAVLLPSGKVLVVGGGRSSVSGSLESAQSAEVYDPETGTWSPTGRLVHPHWAPHTTTLLSSGRVLVFGGNALYWAELYTP
ncbi:Kelch repeat-containing protein [Hyalangium minutum]|nr:kelch repeat-containing protein [Hyalangium minutum]